jgi:hypothetical protein
MANEKQKSEDQASADARSKVHADRMGSHTGAPARPAGDGGADPLRAPLKDPSPERFLSQAPAHIATQNDPSLTPYAVTDPKGRKRYRNTGTQGIFINKILRPLGGEDFWLDPKDAEGRAELTEVDAAGNPVRADKIATRQTGEAGGFQRR